MNDHPLLTQLIIASSAGAEHTKCMSVFSLGGAFRVRSDVARTLDKAVGLCPCEMFDIGLMCKNSLSCTLITSSSSSSTFSPSSSHKNHISGGKKTKNNNKTETTEREYITPV